MFALSRILYYINLQAIKFNKFFLIFKGKKRQCTH